MSENVWKCRKCLKMLKMSKKFGICRNMSENVGLCRNMSEHVGTCRSMSEYVGTCRNMYTIFTYENYLYNRIFNSQIFFFGFFGNVCPHFFLIQKFFFGHHRVPCALICILSLIVGNWTSQKKNRTRQASVLC